MNALFSTHFNALYFRYKRAQQLFGKDRYLKPRPSCIRGRFSGGLLLVLTLTSKTFMKFDTAAEHLTKCHDNRSCTFRERTNERSANTRMTTTAQHLLAGVKIWTN